MFRRERDLDHSNRRRIGAGSGWRSSPLPISFGRSRRVGGVPSGLLDQMRLQWVLRPESGRVRVPADEPCQVETTQALCAATVWNLSRNGAYLALEPVPEIGETLRITFSLASDRVPVACDARVVWSNPASIVYRGLGALALGLPTGCGVEFSGLRGLDSRRIAERIEANLGI
jgi:hypothetical protein